MKTHYHAPLNGRSKIFSHRYVPTGGATSRPTLFAHCSHCDTIGEKAGKRNLPTDVIARWFVQKGWRFHKQFKEAQCPDCVLRDMKRRRPKEVTTGTAMEQAMEKAQVEADAPEVDREKAMKKAIDDTIVSERQVSTHKRVLQLEVSVPRDAKTKIIKRTRKTLNAGQERMIYRMLEEHYDPDAESYTGDHTDETIAEAVGVKVGSVTYRRDRGFGPIKRLLGEGEVSRDDFDAMMDIVGDLETRVQELETLIVP